MRPNSALDAAIALSRAPNLTPLMRARELPGDVALLLRILADDSGAIAEAGRTTGLKPAAIVMIAELYVKEVLLFAGAPSRRVLGLTASADRAEARTNLRLLLSWLHPDKNSSRWQSAFAVRVIAAWRSVQDPQAAHNVDELTSTFGRAGGSHRLPWIARPLTATARSSLRVPRPLLAGLVATSLACGIVVPTSEVLAVYQNLVSAFLGDDPTFRGSPSEISALTEYGSDK